LRQATYTKYPWPFSGTAKLELAVEPYEGTYCSQSGSIIDSQESSMYLTLDIWHAIYAFTEGVVRGKFDYLYFILTGMKWQNGPATFLGLASYPVVPALTPYLEIQEDICSTVPISWVDYISGGR
jgi:hypothetical protein